MSEASISSRDRLISGLEASSDEGLYKPILHKLRFLRNLGIVDSYGFGYSDHGYLIEDDQRIYGKLTGLNHRLEIKSSTDTLVRMEAKLGAYPIGDYETHLYMRKAGPPLVVDASVNRRGYTHTFEGQYATRAAELIVKMISRKALELGYDEVEYSSERARRAQNALDSYESSAK